MSVSIRQFFLGIEMVLWEERVYLSIYLSVYLSICLSVYLSSYLSIYLATFFSPKIPRPSAKN